MRKTNCQLYPVHSYRVGDYFYFSAQVPIRKRGIVFSTLLIIPKHKLSYREQGHLGAQFVRLFPYIPVVEDFLYFDIF